MRIGVPDLLALKLSSGVERSSLWIVVVAVTLALVVTFAVTHVRQRRLKAEKNLFPVPPPGSVSAACTLSEERVEDLVQGLIGTFDLSDSEVVRAHVQKSLRRVGISEIRPMPGDTFDPRMHNGVAAVRAIAPTSVFRIARVLRPGWESEKGTVRPADVEVYKEE